MILKAANHFPQNVLLWEESNHLPLASMHIYTSPFYQKLLPPVLVLQSLVRSQPSSLYVDNHPMLCTCSHCLLVLFKFSKLTIITLTILIPWTFHDLTCTVPFVAISLIKFNNINLLTDHVNSVTNKSGYRGVGTKLKTDLKSSGDFQSNGISHIVTASLVAENIPTF